MSSFVPQFSLIQAITLGYPTVVTFTAPCDFTVGEYVSFRVTPQSGTFELNNQRPLVQQVTTSTITVSINSTNYTPFINVPENETVYPAMVVPAGSGIIPGAIPPQTSLLDVFDNVPIN